jgi:hypothetical protein
MQHFTRVVKLPSFRQRRKAYPARSTASRQPVLLRQPVTTVRASPFCCAPASHCDAQPGKAGQELTHQAERTDPAGRRWRSRFCTLTVKIFNNSRFPVTGFTRLVCLWGIEANTYHANGIWNAFLRPASAGTG